MEQTLRNLIADGKTAKVIAELRRLTPSDEDLKNEIDILSSRFSRHQTQYHLGLEDSTLLNNELNKINNALLAVIDKLQQNDTPSVLPLTSKKGCVISISIALAFAIVVMANWAAFSKLIFNKIEPVSTEVLVIKGLVKDTEGNVLPQTKVVAEGNSGL